MSIINRIVEVLEQKNLKQVDLCNYLNISPSVFATWKIRGTDPQTKYLVQICKFLNISLEYLLTGIESTTIDTSKTVLTENEKDILSLLNQLSERNQIKLIGKVEEIVKEMNQSNNNHQQEHVG